MQKERRCQEIRVFGSGMGSLLTAALGYLSQYDRRAALSHAQLQPSPP